MTSRSCPIRQDGLKSPSLLWNSCCPIIAAAEVGGALTETPLPIQAFA